MGVVGGGHIWGRQKTLWGEITSRVDVSLNEVRSWVSGESDDGEAVLLYDGDMGDMIVLWSLE